MVELLVVTLMLVVMMGAAAPTFVRLRDDSNLRSAARVIVATFLHARSLAVSRHTEARIVFTEDRRTFQIETWRPTEGEQMQFVPERTGLARRRTLPPGVEVMVVRGASQEHEQILSFHTNGTADEAVLTLTNRTSRKLYVLLESITGRASIESDLDRVNQRLALQGR